MRQPIQIDAIAKRLNRQLRRFDVEVFVVKNGETGNYTLFNALEGVTKASVRMKPIITLGKEAMREHLRELTKAVKILRGII